MSDVLHHGFAIATLNGLEVGKRHGVYVMIAFGVIGYFIRKLGYEPAPLVLAFVLGPILENNLRKSLILSQGDLSTFVTRPISAVCFALAVLLLIGPLLPAMRRKRELVALDKGG